MLQQTTVGAVVPYYRRWLKKYPDIGTLARAPLSRILKDWQGLGYYERARNLKAAARLIVSRHEGRIPETVAELVRLPGIGEYTAAAILSLALDKPLPVLEANVRRVMARLLRLRGPVNAAAERKIRSALAALFPRRGA
ncbi:MAG: A/G-specific adenine glycosylase, partial [Candidatus Aminicenantes bacterium]|nr:A/G-specific adenine glycosylase [Candidatus Aminicenantes bacterium]